jgi:hypothetical protein
MPIVELSRYRPRSKRSDNSTFRCPNHPRWLWIAIVVVSTAVANHNLRHSLTEHTKPRIWAAFLHLQPLIRIFLGEIDKGTLPQSAKLRTANKKYLNYVRNIAFWDFLPCSSSSNRRFENYRLRLEVSFKVIGFLDLLQG